MRVHAFGLMRLSVEMSHDEHDNVALLLRKMATCDVLPCCPLRRSKCARTIQASARIIVRGGMSRNRQHAHHDVAAFFPSDNKEGRK